MDKEGAAGVATGTVRTMIGSSCLAGTALHVSPHSLLH